MSEPARRPTSEERNAAIRAAIRPLAPGERPPALIVAIAVCALLAAGNVIVAVSGRELAGARPIGPAVVLAAFLILIGYGMWRGSPTAVLVFLGLLVLSILAAFLAILVAANLQALLVSITIVALAGILFWKLIGVLARLQAPVETDNAEPAGERTRR